MARFFICISMTLFLGSVVPAYGGEKYPQCQPCTCSKERGSISANCTDRNLTRIPETIPHSTEELLLGNNYLTNLENISTFTLLIILNVTCNRITTLSSSTFIHTPLIKILNISNNGLRYVEPDAFTALKQIEVLDISDNPMLNWKEIINTTHGLQDSALKELYMNKIVSDTTICSIVCLDICKDLKNTSLTVLHADRNGVESFDKDCFQMLPTTLENVSLKENRLTLGTYLIRLQLLTGLKDLDVSDEAGLRPLPDLADLITDEREWQDYPTCTDTDRYEVSSSWAIENFEELLFYKIPSNLTRFKCSYKKLSYHINGVNISENSLMHLDLSSNIISTWTGPVYGLEKLTYLNLRNNVARKYSVHFFETFPELRSLDLSNNFIGYILSNDSEGITFSKLEKLESLNLSYNLISFLPERIFRGLKSLKVLDVSHNYIYIWNVSMKHMNNLGVINASSNRIRWLYPDTRHFLDKLIKKTNYTLRVSLSENPLACTCENIHFLYWLLRNERIFLNLKDCICLYTDGTVPDIGNVAKFRRVFKELKKQCSSTFVLNLAILSSSLFAGLMLVLGIVYRYRWKLRYWYYSARLNKTEDRGPDVKYSCDAFVSYADEDMDFVHSQLKVALEEESGLKLIIRDRDFTPTEYEVKNIVNAVHVCRRTVLILSDNFFKRFLCEKELEMAHYEQIETQRNIIIIVMYRQLTVKALPPEIHYRLKSDSYLEYPSGDGDKTAFWQKLLKAIKDED